MSYRDPDSTLTSSCTSEETSKGAEVKQSPPLLRCLHNQDI